MLTNLNKYTISTPESSGIFNHEGIKLMAILLSFLCPGLGHLLNGRAFQGLLFFVLTAIAYCCLFVPGLLMHIFVILDAAKDAERKRRSEMLEQTATLAAVIAADLLQLSKQRREIPAKSPFFRVL